MTQELRRRTYTVGEVATVWHVAPNTVRNMIKRGDLPAFRVGHLYRIDAAYVDAQTSTLDKVAV